MDQWLLTHCWLCNSHLHVITTWKTTEGYWGSTEHCLLCSVLLLISQSQGLSLTSDQKVKASLLSVILKNVDTWPGYIFWNGNKSRVGSLYLGDGDILYFLLWGAVLGQKDIRTVSWSLNPSSTVTVRNAPVGQHHLSGWETMVWRKYDLNLNIHMVK